MPYTLNTFSENLRMKMSKDITDIIVFKSLMYKWNGSRPWDILGTWPISGIPNSSLVIWILPQWPCFDISSILNDSNNSMKMFQKHHSLPMISQHNISLCLFVWDKSSLFCLDCLWFHIPSTSAPQMLGIQVSTTMPGSKILLFNLSIALVHTFLIHNSEHVAFVKSSRNGACNGLWHISHVIAF